MKKVTAFAAIAFCALLAQGTQYSKLAIITATKAVGRWDGLKAWIAASGFEDEWNACQYLSDAYPQYALITNAVVSSGVMSSDELSRVMGASLDEAIPDDLLRQSYANDMSNETGRARWHGKVARTHYDTNLCVKTWYYADGYEFKENFVLKMPASVRDQLSAAERKALNDRAKARWAAAEAKKRQDRIDLLTTNLTAEVTALMARKKWPEELARLYLQQELNELRGTTTVDAVIKPQ